MIVVYLLTAFLRRRRAKKFDKEVEKAAAEAAMATAPRFDDDDNDYPTSSSYPPSNPYSDHSHGTYNQPPMPTETYNMQDFNNYYSNGYDNPYAAAGVAGAGAAGMPAAGNRQSSYNAGAAGGYDYGSTEGGAQYAQP